MNKKISFFVIAVLVLAGIYYWGAGRFAATQQSNSSNVPAAVLAQKDLASRLGIDAGTISVTGVTEATWNDGCLGLGGPAESCLQALVPGYRVEMAVSGKTYAYRTDKTGEVIRAETQ